MQTLHSRFKLAIQTADAFVFAGFSFPRYLSVLHWTHGPAARLARYKNPSTSGYYTQPTPRDGSSEGFGCYLERDTCAGMRYEWADKVEGVRIGNTGWYTDEHGDSDLIRGIVVRLPRSRGFLAGWSMGTGMATSLYYDIHETERDAAYAADDLAEKAAECEREYRLNEEEGDDE